MARTTPAKVNAALKAAGIAIEIVRGRQGYYWFDDKAEAKVTVPVPSIWQNSLRGWTTADVVDHVRKHLNKETSR